MIVRNDLTVGQKCAQLVHAAGESAGMYGRIPKNTVAVALVAEGQAHLLEVRRALALAQIDHVLISECDGEVMALGIMPTRDRAKIRKVVSKLPLVK